MRVSLFLFAFALLSNAQQIYTSIDTSGDTKGSPPLFGPTVVVTKEGKAELSRSINGQLVPLQSTEVRVLHEDANGKTIERLTRRYDATGTSSTPVKEIIEEQNKPGGVSLVKRTVYVGDVNGNLQLQERSSTETVKNGNQETSDTTVERPNINGGFEPSSRQSVQKVINGESYQEYSTTYRPDPNGALVPAVKISKEVTKTGGATKETSAEYEVGPTGDLRLHSEKVQTAVKRPDGSEDVQVKVFAKQLPGIARTFDSNQLSLIEEQHIERRKTSGDTVVETVNVQHPTLADPSTPGPPKQIYEVVCKGKCE